MSRSRRVVCSSCVVAVACWVVGCGDDADKSKTTSMTGGAGGTPPAYVAHCGTLCDATIALGCDDETCAETCVSANINGGPCADVLGGYVACLAANASNIPDCYDYPPDCEDAFIAFASCAPTANGCGPAKCDDPGESSCSCWSICAGATYRKNCTKLQSGFSCTCEIDGDEVATCFEQDLACHVTSGCCEPYLPGNGGSGGDGMGGGGAGGGGAGGA